MKNSKVITDRTTDIVLCTRLKMELARVLELAATSGIFFFSFFEYIFASLKAWKSH